MARYIDRNEELVTIKLKAVIRHRAVSRFGAGGHTQPPQEPLRGSQADATIRVPTAQWLIACS